MLLQNQLLVKFDRISLISPLVSSKKCMPACTAHTSRTTFFLLGSLTRPLGPCKRVGSACVANRSASFPKCGRCTPCSSVSRRPLSIWATVGRAGLGHLQPTLRPGILDHSWHRPAAHRNVETSRSQRGEHHFRLT